MNNTKFTIGIILAVVMIGIAVHEYSEVMKARRIASLPPDGVIFASGFATSGEGGPPSIEINAMLPTNRSAMVYRVIPPDNPEELFREIMREARLSKPFVKSGCRLDNNTKRGANIECGARTNMQHPEKWTSEDYYLELKGISGGFSLRNADWLRAPEEYLKNRTEFFANPPKTISEERAIDIAKDYLAQRGWLPPDDEYRTPNVLYDTLGTFDRESNRNIDVKSQISVAFRSYIDGIEGPGSIRIDMSINGTVRQVRYGWLTIEPYAEANLIPSMEASQKLVSGEIQGIEHSWGERFVVKSVSLHYPGNVWAERIDYLKPYWEFKGDLYPKQDQYEGKMVEGYAVYVPAIQK